ncbi:hypothetical protein ACFVH9_32235 [Streptomyces hirsutus]|uniref:hypothetical protein n=1 Tax=Streptomyces hirsutus TaxID=35620 RepID=UPI003645AA9D
MWVLSSPVSLLLGAVLAIRPDLGDDGLIVRGGRGVGQVRHTGIRRLRQVITEPGHSRAGRGVELCDAGVEMAAANQFEPLEPERLLVRGEVGDGGGVAGCDHHEQRGGRDTRAPGAGLNVHVYADTRERARKRPPGVFELMKVAFHETSERQAP